MKKLIAFFVTFCSVQQLCSQNVGIGTVTPAFKLDVRNGSINTDSVYRIGSNTVLSVQGILNTFVGLGSGESNTTGCCNTAIGDKTLNGNITGGGNTALGVSALRNNTTGLENTASGLQSLFENLSGNYNTAVGNYSLGKNFSGSHNTAVGYRALYNNNDWYNTGIGSGALHGTDHSQYNVAVGYRAGYNYDNGYNNVFVGANTDVNGDGYYNVIAVGQGTVVGGSSRAVFGNAATVFYGGWAGWSSFSDGRFKKNIRENVPGIEFISRLRPVTYNLEATALEAFLHRESTDETSAEAKAVYEKALREKEAITYTGFIAQEVEEAAQQTGFRFSGVEQAKNEKDTYSLRYAEFVVPLVKAVQEQQQMIQALQKTYEEQRKMIEKLISIVEKK